MGCTVSVPHQTFYARDLYNRYRYYTTIENEFFDKGTFRYAFHGTFHGKGPENKKRCVVKVFKETTTVPLSDMKEDLKASALANDLANEFKRTLKSLGLEIDVDVVQPFVATIKRLAGVKTCGLCLGKTDNRYFKRNRYVFIEPFISGDYEKFNSNGGWESYDHPVMTAFFHWTWHRSEGKYMVCDLQGVRSGRGYTLTDPAVHSTNEANKFGGSDCGAEGMVWVLNAHTCNIVCKTLGLINPYSRYRDKFSFEGNKKPSKLYNFQLSKVDMIYAQRLIAIRKPIPDPIPIVILPIIVDVDNSSKMENAKDDHYNIDKENEPNLTAPRVYGTGKQIFGPIRMAVLPAIVDRPAVKSNRQDMLGVNNIRDNKPDIADIRENRENKPGVNGIREDIQSVRALRVNRPGINGIPENKTEVNNIGENSPGAKVMSGDVAYVKEKLHQPKRNADKVVGAGDLIFHGPALPCNFYCNHCLSEEAVLAGNKWTFT